MDDGDGCILSSVYLITLNCKLKNSYDGEFYGYLYFMIKKLEKITKSPLTCPSNSQEYCKNKDPLFSVKYFPKKYKYHMYVFKVVLFKDFRF